MTVQRFPFMRNGFIALLIAVLLSTLALPATTAERMIGVVLSGDLPRYREAHRAFVRSMAQQGYSQENLGIFLQVPNPDPLSWGNAVRKCSALGAEMIVAYGAPAAQVAVREGGGVPVVYVDVYGPIETGIAQAKGAVGVSAKVPLVTLLKTATEYRPNRTIGVVYSSREVGTVVQLKEVRRYAATIGATVRELNVTNLAALEEKLVAQLPKLDSLFVGESVVAGRNFDRIIHHAREAKVPVLSTMPGACERGALASLEISPTEQGELAAEQAARLLGRGGAGLAMRQPKQIDLVINLKVAKALDLNIPFQVLSMATRVVK